jgi:hypothetical protein
VTAKSRSVTAIVTPGYAPIEQYSSRGNQGPWTDIYAVGAICYRAMTGEVPVDATERVRRDPLVPVSEHPVSKGAYSADLCAAVDEALKVDEDARPQSVAAWRAILSSEAVRTEKLAPAKPADPMPSPVQKDAAQAGRGGLVTAGIFALVLGAGGAALLIDPMGWFDPQKVASGEPALEAPADTETASVPVDDPAPAILEIDEEPAPAVLAADPPAPDLMGTAAERAAVILELQAALKTLGHYNSAVNGSSGRETQLAVSAFGRAEGIGVPLDLSSASLGYLKGLTARAEKAAAEFERREREAWAIAREIDTKPAYEVYLDGYPSGLSAPAARARMQQLEDIFLNTAVASGSVDELRKFLETYPNTEARGLVEEKIEAISNATTKTKEAAIQGSIIGFVEEVNLRDRYIISVKQSVDIPASGSSIWIETANGQKVPGVIEKQTSERFSITVQGQLSEIAEGDPVLVLN